jgi:hypothetical protein
MKSSFSGGLTVLEMILGIALVAVSVTIVTLSFSKVNSNESIDSGVSLVISVLDEARNMTLSGVGGAQYGVYLEESQVTLFKGASYSAGSPDNEVTQLPSLVGVRNITLAGGGSSVVFQKLTGATTQSGTFEVYLKSAPSQLVRVNVGANGIAEEN